MVFSSLYLDPENNWHQQQANQHQLLGINENFHQFQPPPPPPPTVSTRAGPIADRAHLAKITQPETPLKCPRCDSIDTKFCYFNNYSLSQPRHFCKTCRRYWTRGGALRNVPVGGGYRRNKRKRRTKSPVNASTSGCSTISGFPSSTRVTDNMLNDLNRSPQLPLLPPLHFLGGYSSSDVGLSFGGSNLGYQIGMMSSSGVDQPSLSSGIFPFLGNLETVSCELQGVLEQEQLTSYSRQDHQLRAFSKQLDNISGDTQLVPVKREGNHSLNLSKNVLGVPENDQIWNGNAWRSDLFGYASSATNHLL